uniref:UDP-glucuronosyltransferase n=1 Tax=Stomoxys calcitrans TaxID=35570 RepID=A0A1I8PEC4_STOCA
MAERGHNVTVVSLLPLREEWLHPSMTYIQMGSVKGNSDLCISATRGFGLRRFLNALDLMDTLIRAMAEMLEHPKMQELIHNRDNKFDLILYGYMYIDFVYGLAEHFDCPVALLWANMPVAPLMQIIGNPMEMSYTPLGVMNSIPWDYNLGLLFRVKNIFSIAAEYFMLLLNHWSIEGIYRKHFGQYASMSKAKERVSMVLFSHHFSEKPVPLVPAMIEVGGIHLNEQPDPLPKDIENFITDAEEGVILFTLGTNVKEDHLHPKTLDKIYNVLSKLPQKVLWKCDDEYRIPGNSSNILFRSWLPQRDILAHPKVKLLFGHGGKGGITEAKFYGVPIVGMPLFADQFLNMNEVVVNGYGLMLEHGEALNDVIIYATVNEVLENKTYSRNVKQFSKLYRDRPLSIKDNAVYWLEYLIRYKGALHMQSPLKTMSFVEANNLDLYLLLSIALYLLWRSIKFVAKGVGDFKTHISNVKIKMD